MELEELLSAIQAKHPTSGTQVRPAVTSEKIAQLEERIGGRLPSDFRIFYRLCNGFEVEEDQFQFLSLEDVLGREGNFGDRWFFIAEYMTYSDMWTVRLLGDEQYEIFCTKEPKAVSTRSLTYFLERFLQGGVFDERGLYDLHAEASSR